MPVFETFPYTNFHELNLEWVMKNVKTLLDKYENIDVDTLKAMLQNYIDEQIALLGELKHIHTYNEVQYYVDCINGSNITGDGSAANPYYSVAKALDVMEQTGAGAFIRLMSPGTYTIPKANIVGCSLQFSAMSTGVTIQWLADASSSRPKELRAASLSIQGYYDGTTVFAPNGLADVLADGSTFALKDASLVGAQDLTFYFKNSFGSFESTTINMAIVGQQSLLCFTDGTVFLESQRVTNKPCINVEQNCILMLNDTIDTSTLTLALTSAIVQATAGCKLFLEASGFSYGSTLATGIYTMYVGSSEILCGHNSSIWLDHVNWNRVLYNGSYYTILLFANGSPLIKGAWVLLQSNAAYNTGYQTQGVHDIGIKATVTCTGFPDLVVYVTSRVPASGDFNIFLGQIGSYTYQLNLTMSLAGVKVVSATQLDVTTGTATTSQAPEVSFDLYLLP